MSAKDLTEQLFEFKQEHLHKPNQRGVAPAKEDEWAWLQARIGCETLDQLERMNTTLQRILDELKLNNVTD